MTSVLEDLAAFDLRRFRAAARHDGELPDRVLPRLTSSAHHGLLWLLIAGVLAGTGQRRAVVRGRALLAAASALANAPAQWSARRARPPVQPVPLPGQLPRQPTTSSFPSGHSASAAAFAGLALRAAERPLVVHRPVTGAEEAERARR